LKTDGGEVASVIDIGSNTIKFLVAAKGLKVLDHGSEDVRIGTGMGRGGPIVLQEQAMNAAAQCVRRLWEGAEAFSPKHRCIVATSAVRDARNRDDFAGMVREATGEEIRILTGVEEAQYVGDGVAHDPNIAARKPFYLMDLGGGSLEILEYGGGMVRQKVSLPLGAVRLKEKLIADPAAPMNKGDIAEVAEYIAESLFASGFDFRSPAAMVGTGGGLTHARFLIGADKGLSQQDSSPMLSLGDMRALMLKVSGMSIAERRNLPHLPAARADIMPVAMIVLTTVMELATAGSIVHSFYNLRYGIAAELLGD
jgi:exopolyphosphatase/guanosine-5'-triphosphate,3'-diphosphate pyrophosphatase